MLYRPFPTGSEGRFWFPVDPPPKLIHLKRAGLKIRGASEGRDRLCDEHEYDDTGKDGTDDERNEPRFLHVVGVFFWGVILDTTIDFLSCFERFLLF